MTRAHIALGGNLGDVAATFESALARLEDNPAIKVRAVSSNHGTRPVGKDAGDAFLNAAAELETTLPPAELLAALHEIEAAEGRVRTVRWGPRTLDLDLLLHGDAVVDDPHLVVPHPALWYRRFVLDPLVEIAPDIVHPVKRLTIGELRTRLIPRPLRVSVLGLANEHRAELIDGVASRFGSDDVDLAIDRPEEATIALWFGSADGIESLPLVPRFDASTSDDHAGTVIDVLTAALG